MKLMLICVWSIASIYAFSAFLYFLDRLVADFFQSERVNLKAVADSGELKETLERILPIIETEINDVKRFAANHQLKPFQSDLFKSANNRKRLAYRIDKAKWPWQLRRNRRAMIELWLYAPYNILLSLITLLSMRSYYIVYFIFEDNTLKSIELDHHVTSL